ncbi:unnamed protein product [Symbiodinium sp. CCMP2592]|nr:unnamed protein product [Symbiodinium sp. CCMP2592]
MSKRSVDGSTAVPESALSDDDMETSSGRSNRTQSQLGSGRVARNIRRTLLHHAGSEAEKESIRGLTNQQLLTRRDGHRQAGAAAAIFPTAGGEQQPKLDAGIVYGDLVRQQVSVASMMEMFLESLQNFEAELSSMHFSSAELEVAGKITSLCGRCCMCDKVASDAHLTSKVHEMKLKETALLVRMLGEPKKFGHVFRFGGGCVGPLTQENIKNYWGEVENLIKAARNKSHFHLKATGAASSKVVPRTARQFEIVVVSYDPTQGCKAYRTSSLAVDWCNVPATAATTTMPALPPGQTWWPVVRLGLDPLPGKHVSDGELEAYCCVYQLLQDPAPAWWFG